MEDTYNTVVIYSFIIYYNAITLSIREMMDSALFANYVPALGTQKSIAEAMLFLCPDGPFLPYRSILLFAPQVPVAGMQVIAM